MTALKRLVGAYMALLAAAVAGFFIINPFLVDSLDVMTVWYALYVMMAVGLGLALIFNYAYKREDSNGDLDGPATRRYMNATMLFHLTVAVSILFFHRWFSLLALGEDNLAGNHEARVLWAIVDTLAPITMGITGCRLWSEANRQ